MMGDLRPLSFLSAGTEATIAEVRAGKGMRSRLSGMGFCPETRVTVQCADRGSLIVSVGDARYALSRGVAMKVLVKNTPEES
ncbi:MULTISPECIES: FeoA family protein [unclassified Methanoculleus]|jgi:ferrous iron transport protein A|uniref:FeoA family protein n=1 Tax=Methanoculleus palmolei TaxID=72612 RepID=A0ABD8ABL5_9EURY|nr:FeoA family protein [Methanoculleus sp. UBA377]MDD2472642.1 FeoA family protein [Methanoculleus sp.]WOX56066.1 FeoA family protein [Methanoculleus palmolei]